MLGPVRLNYGPYHSLWRPPWDGTPFTPKDHMVRNKFDVVGHLKTSFYIIVSGHKILQDPGFGNQMTGFCITKLSLGKLTPVVSTEFGSTVGKIYRCEVYQGTIVLAYIF